MFMCIYIETQHFIFKWHSIWKHLINGYQTILELNEWVVRLNTSSPFQLRICYIYIVVSIHCHFTIYKSVFVICLILLYFDLYFLHFYLIFFLEIVPNDNSHIHINSILGRISINNWTLLILFTRLQVLNHIESG